MNIITNTIRFFHIEFRQFSNCLTIAWKLLVKAFSSLVIMLLFPVIAVICTVQVAGEDMFTYYNETRSACFLLVCACIWGGLFNSVQLIVKQRDTIQADLSAGLYPCSFMAANAIMQLVLCAVQSGILCLCFPLIQWKYGNSVPKHGVIFDNAIVEYYISFLLIFYAADTMGMIISTLVKKAETASVITPYILIVELILSGVLFELHGITDKISYAMISRWGMEALGTTSNLNRIRIRPKNGMPRTKAPFSESFDHTVPHLNHTWIILGCFCVVSIIVADILIHRFKNTKNFGRE